MDGREPGAWSALLRAPMLRLVLPLLAGLLVARIAPAAGATGVVVLGVLLVPALWLLRRRLAYEHRALRGAGVAAFLFAFGVVWGGVRTSVPGEALATADAGGRQDLLVRLDLVDRSRSGYWRADADVLARREGMQGMATGERLRLTLAPDSGLPWLRTGDLLWVRARPEPIVRVPDPGGFDLRTWAASRGVHREAFVGTGSWVHAGHRWRPADLFSGARERVAGWLGESGLPGPEQDIARALLLGDRSGLEQEQRDAFARSGTMHVLAVSGLHVGLIFAVLAVLLGWWGNRRGPMWLRGLVILAGLWAYAGLTGGSPSVVRAATMFSLFTLAGMVGRQSDSLNSLAAAAFILLVADPRMLGQLSFQFSFLAVLGILLFHDPLRRLWVPPNRVLGYLWSLLVVSVAAQLMTTPLALVTFKAFPLWFLPANLVVVSLVTLAVYGGGLLLVLHQVPVVGQVVVFIMTWLLKALAGATVFFAGLPGAYPDIRLDTWQALLLYVLIGAVGARVAWRWRPGLPIACVLLLILCVGWAWTARERNRQEAFVAYGGGNGLELALIRGRELVVLSDRDDSHARRRSEAHRRAWGLRSVRRGPAVEQEGIVALPAADWPVIAYDRSRRTDIPAGHWVVLAGDRQVDPEPIIRAGPAGVLLSASMPGARRAYLRRTFAAQGVPVHDLREQGAFILRR